MDCFPSRRGIQKGTASSSEDNRLIDITPHEIDAAIKALTLPHRQRPTCAKVIWQSSYHDQWMSEGFAEFSSSLYVQFTRGEQKFLDFWEDLRKLIIEASPATKDRKPFTVGPVTQGYRLNSGKTGSVARRLIYPKGAYILHMLRMMMMDHKGGSDGDARFKTMMTDFVQTHFNQDVSTEDFKAIVEKHMTPEMKMDKSGNMDWFFNQWVYGTQVPAYKFEYSATPEGVLNGKVTQSGVSDDFKMLVPIYVDFGKGWVRLGAARINGNSSVELKNIKLRRRRNAWRLCDERRAGDEYREREVK